ncbi:MAG: MFS transporter [Planctomycetaceae bacterium]
MTSANSQNSRQPAHPTQVRWLMILLATLTAVLLYLDRVCISTAGTTVAANLRITKAQLDEVLGAFFLTYALGQLPAGWLGDRFGARWTLGLYIFLWSLATGLLAFARTLSALLILRLACGLFEAGAYPLAAGIVRRWVPAPWRGTASAIIAVGGRLGGAIAPILTIQLMLAWTYRSDWSSMPPDARADLNSWRPVMGLYGLAGMLGAGVFVLLFRDWPHLHPAVNTAELNLIQVNEPVSNGNAQPPSEWPPIMAMICSFPMWMNCAVQFSANLGWGFLVTKLPQFLEETFGSSQQQQGWMQSLPLAAGIIGLFLGGLFTDSLTRTFGPRWGRSLAMSGSRLFVVVSLAAVPFAGSAWTATLLLAVVGLATDLGTPAVWAFGQDVGGRFTGSAVGWANMWGNFGVAVSPAFFGWIVGTSNAASGWNRAFMACAAVNLIAAVAALGVNAAKPLVPAHQTYSGNRG